MILIQCLEQKVYQFFAQFAVAEAEIVVDGNPVVLFWIFSGVNSPYFFTKQGIWEIFSGKVLYYFAIAIVHLRNDFLKVASRLKCRAIAGEIRPDKIPKGSNKIAIIIVIRTSP